MDRREQLIANILSHVTVRTKRDGLGQDWYILEIRRRADDKLLFETKFIAVEDVFEPGLDLYTDIAALSMFDEYHMQIRHVERNAGAKGDKIG